MPEPGDRFTGPRLAIRPWAVNAEVEFPARSAYVELVWAGVLGPTTLLTYRRLTGLIDVGGDTVDLSDLAAGLGVRYQGGRHSPMVRALDRLVMFKAATFDGDALAVRAGLPPVPEHRLGRLGSSAVRVHHRALEEHPARPSPQVGESAPMAPRPGPVHRPGRPGPNGPPVGADHPLRAGLMAAPRAPINAAGPDLVVVVVASVAAAGLVAAGVVETAVLFDGHTPVGLSAVGLVHGFAGWWQHPGQPRQGFPAPLGTGCPARPECTAPYWS